MIKNFIKFIFRPIYEKYQALLFSISNLEISIDCLINNPKYVESKETGFNGQANRKLIFQTLLQIIKFDAIVETGTYLGDTTGYMATCSHLPVYTCEIDKRFNALARMRLRGISNITFALSDSRCFLRNLFVGKNILTAKRIFVYLDAHWYSELPLREELEIIFSSSKDFVVMIDDFKVPGDNGYGYDNYGKGRELSLQVLQDLLSDYKAIAFFPTLLSSEETGFRRGCVILAGNQNFIKVLQNVQSLREHLKIL